MVHSHEHAANRSAYYLDQLCSVGACAALGAISILMWQSGRIAVILAPQFHLPVMIGGIALLIVAAIQALSIWRAAGRESAQNREQHHHDHEGPCDHDHNHADCGHDHDHSWTPAKYALLLLPVLLYLLGLPHSGFSNEMLKKNMGNFEIVGTDRVVTAKGEDWTLGFKELSNAANSEAMRQQFEGKTVRLKGMFMRMRGDKEFTLFKIRMRCCAADAIPMQVRIIAPGLVGQYQDREWVEARGIVEFRQIQGQNKFIPVVTVGEMSDIKRIPPEPTEFDFS